MPPTVGVVSIRGHGGHHTTMDMTEAVETYLLLKRQRCSPRTIELDQQILAEFVVFLGDRPIDLITTSHIRLFIEHERERGLGEHTVKRKYASLSALWAWMSSEDVGLVPANVVRRVPTPRPRTDVVRGLTGEQIEGLFRAAQTSKYPRRARAILLFFLDTGCRATEMRTARMEDVNWLASSVLVTGKGNKQRFVYFGDRCLQALRLYISVERPRAKRPEEDMLFLTEDGYAFGRYSVRSIIRRLGQEAGFICYPHLLRHTCAIERLRNGMDLAILQRLMGHANPRTTIGYLSALNDEDVAGSSRTTSPGDRRRL